MEFVKNFTLPDFQAKHFTPLFSLKFNSFGDKNTKKWAKMEKFAPLAKISHCRWQWRQWQISPLWSAISLIPLNIPNLPGWTSRPSWCTRSSMWSSTPYQPPGFSVKTASSSNLGALIMAVGWVYKTFPFLLFVLPLCVRHIHQVVHLVGGFSALVVTTYLGPRQIVEQ